MNSFAPGTSSLYHCPLHHTVTLSPSSSERISSPFPPSGRHCVLHHQSYRLLNLLVYIIARHIQESLSSPSFLTMSSPPPPEDIVVLSPKIVSLWSVPWHISAKIVPTIVRPWIFSSWMEHDPAQSVPVGVDHRRHSPAQITIFTWIEMNVSSIARTGILNVSA